MKFSQYLKDKLPIITAGILVILAVFFIEKAFLVNPALILLTLAFIVIGALFSIFWDFYRKAVFYRELQERLDALDQKYLILETIERPDHLEGRIFTELLEAALRSMAENVRNEKTKTNDFKEYIETWAHEIKMPLSALNLILQNKECPKEWKERCIPQVRRAERCLEKVLFYARAEQAEKDFLIKKFVIADAVHEAVMLYFEDFRELDFTIETKDLQYEIFSDQKWLVFILGQIFSNSIKYRKDEQHILSITAQRNKDQTKLMIRDRGIGISPSDLPRVFDKCFTGENGRKGAASTGMGLYLAAEMCKKMGHEIKAQSVQGEYTQISIIFHDHDYYLVR